MKLTNEQVVIATGLIQSLAGTKLPARVSLRVGRVARVLRHEQKAIGEAQNELLDNYVNKTVDGELKKVTTGRDGDFVRWDFKDKESYNSEWRDLLDDTVELSVKPLDMDDVLNGLEAMNTGVEGDILAELEGIGIIEDGSDDDAE